MKDILKKIRLLEIKTRKQVDSIFAGEYHTAFKGQGLEFDEVRPYQYGDDIRSIDWNVTARTGELFIKKFKEEREQTLFVLFDISGSEDFGPTDENKRHIGTEITAILSFSALKNNDKIGMATFSDQIEQYYKPQKGRKHVLKLLRGLIYSENKSRLTSVHTAIDFVRHTLKKHSIIIVISDFLDQDFEQSLIRLNKKHEVILIRLFHPNELFRFGVGTVPIVEIESGQYRWLNSGDVGYRKKLNENFEGIGDHLRSLARRHQIGYIEVDTSKDYAQVLRRFFRDRNKQRS